MVCGHTGISAKTHYLMHVVSHILVMDYDGNSKRQSTCQAVLHLSTPCPPVSRDSGLLSLGRGRMKWKT